MAIIHYVLILVVFTPLYLGDRYRRSTPQTEVACTIFTLAKSCTDVLQDCATLCDSVQQICHKLSKMAKISMIACSDNSSISSQLEILKDPEVAHANGIENIEQFWTKLEMNPLNVIKSIMNKLIANGALQLSATQFLGRFDDGISNAAKSISDNALTNNIQNEVANTGSKLLDGSLTPEDVVNSGSAIVGSIGQGAEDVGNGIKDTAENIGNTIGDGFNELSDLSLDNIDDKAKELGNKITGSVNSLLDETKNVFDNFLGIFDNSSATDRCINLILLICLLGICILVVH